MAAFIAVTDLAMELETVFRSANLAQNSRSTVPQRVTVAPPPLPPVVGPPSLPAPVLAPTPLRSSAPAVERVPRAPLTCSNCGRSGHITATCFQPGGGMEGRRGEYRGNKTGMMAMFAEMMEDAFVSCDTPLLPDDLPLIPGTLDADIVVPSAHLSVASFVASNDSIKSDYYSSCDSPERPMAFVSTSFADFESTAFLSLGGRFNSALDSGCTDHIFRDRKYFQDYDVTKAVSIGTANSGSLEAHGGGTVSFSVPYCDKRGAPATVVVTLRDCLYAPCAPINLISVGSLTEHGLKVVFNPGASTDISMPLDDPDVPGFTFTATVFRRLSLLNCKFILPGDDLLKPSALPAISFPSSVPTPHLWHRRFGHLGQDATRAALTQDYVRGAVFEGPFIRENCRRAHSIPMLTTVTGLLVLVNCFTWIFSALILLRVPMASAISALSLMTSPTLALQPVSVRRVMRFPTTRRQRRSLSGLLAARLRQFGLMAPWNLPLAGWGCTSSLGASLSSKRCLTLTNRLGR